MRQETFPSRRSTSRIGAAEDVWVLWQDNGHEDVSRVRDMSLGGIFIETPKQRSTGAMTKLHFLVPEGQIRAEAVVRHAMPNGGIGLKLTVVREEDRLHLAALVRRLRGLSRFRGAA